MPNCKKKYRFLKNRAKNNYFLLKGTPSRNKRIKFWISIVFFVKKKDGKLSRKLTHRFSTDTYFLFTVIPFLFMAKQTIKISVLIEILFYWESGPRKKNSIQNSLQISYVFAKIRSSDEINSIYFCKDVTYLKRIFYLIYFMHH